MRNMLWCFAPLALVFGCGKVAETCEDVELINSDYEPLEAESGIRYCEATLGDGGGFIRDMAVDCPELVGPAACPEDQLSDCDCGDGEVCGLNIEGYGHCECYAPCATDADCGADEVCFCASRRDPTQAGHNIMHINTCLPSECDGPDDCGGELCGVALDSCQGAAAQRCHTAEDACDDDGDCDGNEQCTYAESEARWTCQEKATCE